MPFDVSLAESTLREELAKIGVPASQASFESLDSAGAAFVVTIVSTAFDGRTYMDREMRVRPAVARTFNILKQPRASFTIEAQTPDEASSEQELSQDASVEASEDETERISRRQWREQLAAISAALVASRYSVSPLEPNVIVATRSQLSEEKLLIAFATSTKAKTVDLETRKLMQAARASQRFSEAFYISPQELESPFANQSRADWLKLHTVDTFLHLLNGSLALADRLRKVTPVDPRPSALGIYGPVIEPDVRAQDGSILEGRFFEVIERWATADQPSMLVLLAPAGHGKTTLTLELTRRFAERFFSKCERAPVPLFVPFESVRRTVDFEALMHKRLAELHGGSFGAFAELLKLNQGVLFVDGFDELADDAGTNVAESQIRSMKPLMQGRAKVLLAGRSLFTQQFAGEETISSRIKGLLGNIDVQILEIVPFSVEQIREYVKTREPLSAKQAEDVIEFAEATPDHLELSANPLFLKTLCALAASGQLPQRSEVASGVDLLIDKICEREEERQNLGLGVAGQLEFLTWIATDLFRSGSLSLSGEEVRLVASMLAESMSRSDGELVGRLADHALLTSSKGGAVTFIHPLFRDVTLGRAVAMQMTRDGKVGPSSPLAERDLPTGTVHHLARSAASILGFLPNSWLSNPAALPAKARRNCFRIAAERARFRTDGSPREWIESHWVADRHIRGLDLSNLVVESISFDGLRIGNCSFAYSLMDDCDFRDTIFTNCVLTLATFIECRLGKDTTFPHCDVGETELRFGSMVVRASTDADIAVAVARFGEAKDVAHGVSAAAAAAARELVRAVLSQFLDIEQAKFFDVGIKTLRQIAKDDRERVAVSRVVVPGVISHFCDVHLASGSREMAGIAKQWRRAVVEFVREGRMTAAMENSATKLIAKAARYLE